MSTLRESKGDDRTYPVRPILGVGGAVVADGMVLLIRRAQEPMRGQWTLPGGALETGETMLEGLVREIAEETGLAVKPMELLAMLDRIVRDEDDRVQFHYVLLDWLCELAADSGTPDTARAGSDADEVAWVSAEDLEAMPEIDDVTRRVAQDALQRAKGRL